VSVTETPKTFMRINRKHSPRAFTLIELLVVITIIAVLAAFLFPVFGSIRQRSKQNISINNLKQWGVALNRSLGDYNGYLPDDGQLNFSSIKLTDSKSWFNRLPPYIDEKPLSDPFYATNPPKPGDRSVWVNPAVPKDDGMQYVKPPNQFLFCYAMNAWLYNGQEKTPDHTQPLSRIEYPSATVFMAEKNDGFANCVPSKIKAYFGPGNPSTDMNNAAHFLFCDGHVELIKRSVFNDASATDNVTIDPHFTFIPFLGADSS
jgi:prepilin-type N-terminal cleavage/methylation domain-containing protein/prepilin-type processing-associated H-X9-DG protein